MRSASIRLRARRIELDALAAAGDADDLVAVEIASGEDDGHGRSSGAPGTKKPVRGPDGLRSFKRTSRGYSAGPAAVRNALATSSTSLWLTATSTPIVVSASVVTFADAASSSALKAAASTLAR